MKLFSNIRSKRSIAFVALLFWVFALASGVANACLLEARGTHLHVAAGLADATHAPAISPGHAGVIADHGDDSRASKAPCLKACADGESSVSPQKLRSVQIDLAAAPLVAVLWTATVPVVFPFSRIDEMRPTTSERPLRVRYSRLAL